MGMGEVKFRGEEWTWANNREGEGFIMERLDRFFGSSEWLLEHDAAEVQHILKQTSDHSLLFLDSNLPKFKIKTRFICEARWIRKPEFEEIIKKCWDIQIEGSNMYSLQQKLKKCK